MWFPIEHFALLELTNIAKLTFVILKNKNNCTHFSCDLLWQIYDHIAICA